MNRCTLFTDVDSLPTLEVLQNGLRSSNDEDVEEMVTLYLHLLRFALDDLGVPNPKSVSDVLFAIDDLGVPKQF